MEYPGAILTKPIRRAIFVLFIVAFFILAPGVILYTAGYRYDFKNGLLRETGSLSIDIKPSNAVVYLDGLKLSGSLPIQLKNITPHQYILRLSAPGYYDWQKQIEVDTKQTTYIKDITLIKKSVSVPLVMGDIRSESLAPSGNYLIYATIRKNQQVLTLWNTATEASTTLFVIPTSATWQALWAPKNSFVAIRILGGQHADWTFNAASPGLSSTKLEDVIPGSISKLQWQNSNDPELYYATPGTIGLFSPELSQFVTTTNNRYQDWLVGTDGLWTLQASSTVGLTITQDTLGFQTIFGTVTSLPDMFSWRLAAAQNGSVLLANVSSSQMLIVQPSGEFPLTTSNFLVSPFNNWWLLWSPSELWTDSPSQAPYLLTRAGATLSGVVPLDDQNTLALQWGDRVTALYPYYFVEHDLLTHAATSIAADSDRRILYYTDKDGLWKINY